MSYSFLKASLLQLKNQEIIIEHDEDKNKEFFLNLYDSPKEKIDFRIWLYLRRGNVSIETEYKTENSIYDSIKKIIKSLNGRCVGLTLAVEQAHVTKDILEHYVSSFCSHQVLKEEKTIKAVQPLENQ